MAYYKLNNPTGNADDTLQVHAGTVGCCGDNSVENTYTSAAANLGVNAVEKIVIDAVEYTFSTPATTGALLKAGIKEALEAAGYRDIKGVGVTISGADSAAVSTVKTTATLTKLINDAPADLAYTAA